MSSNLENELHSWGKQSLLLLRELLPLMSAVGAHRNFKPEEKHTLTCLLTACARSTESAVLLTAYGQLWDSELLVRSIAEGTLKVCYLLQSRQSFAARHKEYADDLWRIALLQDHKKAADLLAAVADPDSSEWQPIKDRLLADAEREEIVRAYSKKQRRNLETRWGFTGLVGEMGGSGDALFAQLGGFGHSYSLSSHILHADYVGVSIPMERGGRSSKRQDAIHLAHAARLLSDCFSFLALRLTVAYRFMGSELAPIVEGWKKVEAMETIRRTAYQNWMEIEYPQATQE